MKLQTLLVVPALIAASLLFAPAAHAEVVTNWQSDITVGTDGGITVKETIDYNPEDGTHHGIIRDIPAQLQDASGHSYYYDIKFMSATDERGNEMPLATKREGRAGLYLKIGDTTLLDPGEHFYVVTYRLTPALTHTGTTDRLNLNIIGEQWPIPVQSAGATIHLPATASIQKSLCFTGPAGSVTASDCTATSTAPGEIALATTVPLDAHDAMTADITMASLGLGAYLQADKPLPLTPLERATQLLGGLANALVWVGLIWLGVRSYRQWQARRGQTIIPIYEAPAKLTPAHLSVLESPAADVADITATLIHLAVRGVVKIEQTRAKAWWRGAGYRLTKLTSSEPIAPFEQTLLDGIFKSDTTIDLDNIGQKRPQLQTAIAKFRELLGKDLTTSGYFFSSPTGWLLGTRIATGVLAMILGILAAIMIASGDATIDTFALLMAVAAVLTAIGFLSLCRKPSGRTESGNKEWAQIRGFKWFLEVTEKDRLNFTDAPDKTPELFSEMLPYAVALKVEKQWAKQFAGIDVSPAVSGWYAGYAVGNFSADAFTSSFSSSFGGAMTSGFSGASGGGMAGGGVGGGGGGSW